MTHPPERAVGHARHCLQQARADPIAGKLGWVGIRGAAAAPAPQGEVGDLGRQGWGGGGWSYGLDKERIGIQALGFTYVQFPNLLVRAICREVARPASLRFRHASHPTHAPSPTHLATAPGFPLNDLTPLLTSRLSCCSLACASSAAAAASPCAQRNGIAGSSPANRPYRQDC